MNAINPIRMMSWKSFLVFFFLPIEFSERAPILKSIKNQFTLQSSNRKTVRQISCVLFFFSFIKMVHDDIGRNGVHIETGK